MSDTSDNPEIEGQAGQYLSFDLNGEDYGVEILRVQEIRGWEPMRSLPGTPDYVKGVLDLRGTVVPIIDLRGKFGMTVLEYTPVTVIIVLVVKTDDGSHMFGAVVDAVSDVLDVAADEVRVMPSLGTGIDTRYIGGMVRRNDKMVMLLDVDKMFSPDEMNMIASIEQT